MSFRKNVFVLGAGFSKDAGAMTMDAFFPHARDLLDDPTSALTAEDKKIFSRVIEYRFELNKALAKILEDLDNIEKLFGFLEMEAQLWDLHGQLQEDMKYLIGRTLEVDTFSPPPNMEGRPVMKDGTKFSGNQYDFFLRVVAGVWNKKKLSGNRSIDSIVSFNYDLVLERQLASLNIVPMYECGPNAAYDPRFFAPTVQPEILLLKLHGSLNWGICRKCNKLFHLPYNPYLVKNLSENQCQRCGSALLSDCSSNLEQRDRRGVYSERLAGCADGTDGGRSHLYRGILISGNRSIL